MRIVPNKIIFLLAAFLCCNFLIAAPGPPPPEIPVTPPGTPIDGAIALLFVMSIFLGFIKIYKTKKASI